MEVDKPDGSQATENLMDLPSKSSLLPFDSEEALRPRSAWRLGVQINCRMHGNSASSCEKARHATLKDIRRRKRESAERTRDLRVPPNDLAN